MQFDLTGFGMIEIDHKIYQHDVVVDNGIVSKRKKGKSKQYKLSYGHTPLSADENIPWDCKTLIIGTGHYGSLPVMNELEREAEKRNIQLRIMKTADACQALSSEPEKTNAVLHITC